MKTKSIFSLAIVSLATLLLATSCTKDEKTEDTSTTIDINQLKGKWNMTYIDYELYENDKLVEDFDYDPKDEGYNISIDFYSDTKCATHYVDSFDNERDTFSYSVIGNSIIMDGDTSEVVNLSSQELKVHGVSYNTYPNVEYKYIYTDTYTR